MTALNSNARIAVIGAGAMGAGIAQVAAQAGHPVLLLDNRPGAAAQAIEGIARQLGKRVDNGKLSAESRSATLTRLLAVEAIEALADCELVIEAIVENLEVKRALFRQLLQTLTPVVAEELSEPPVRDMDEALETFGPGADGIEPLLKPMVGGAHPVNFYPKAAAPQRH